MCRIRTLLTLAAACLLIAAGCPSAESVSETTRPSSSSSSGTPSGNSSGSTSGNSSASGDFVGPAAPTSNDASTSSGDSGSDAGATSTGGAAESPPVDPGGIVLPGSAVSDALSIDFPGCAAPADAAFWKAEVLRLVNQERLARGAGPVTWSDALADSADQYACELIFFRFFDHENPVTGEDLAARADAAGYDYWIVGENLAAGQQSPAQVFADWMNSPCHRENIVNPAFTELGVGVRVGGQYGTYWVQEFGRPFTAARPSSPAYHEPGCTHGS